MAASVLGPRRSRFTSLTLWMLALVPPLLTVGGVLWFGVDVPVGDQWTLAPILERLELGNEAPYGLFAQANESRPAFPRLLFVGLARLGYWNVKREMLATQFLLMGTSLGLVLLVRQYRGDGAVHTAGFALAANMLLFSWTQYENFLWGIQFILYVPFACLVAACLLVLSRRPLHQVVLLVALLNIIATYSYANGMLLWPLTAAALASIRWSELRDHWRPAMLFTGAFAASVALYFWDFDWPTGHPSIWVALSDPLRAVAGTLVFLGSGFSFAMQFGGYQVLIAAGAALALAALLLPVSVYLFRNRDGRALRNQLVIGLVFVAYGVGSAAVTAAGRLGFGMEYLLASRYTAFSFTAFLGAAVLAHAVVVHAGIRQAASRAWVTQSMVAIAAALAVLWGLANVQSVAHILEVHRSRLQARAILPFVLMADEQDVRAVMSFQGSAPVRRWLPRLVERGVLPPLRDRVTWVTAHETQRASHGALERFQVGEYGDLVAEGWTYLPEEHRAGDAVLVTARQEEVLRAISVTVPSTPRHDIVARTGAPRAFRSGWKVSLNGPAIPGLELWTLNGRTGEAYRLGSLTKVPAGQ